MSKVVLITGGSSGIGYESALMLASKGHRVYAAARRTDKLEPLKEHGIQTLHLDVNDEASARQCVQAVLDAEGHIDVLVNNAGYGYFGPVECVSLEEARSQMETNVFGLATMCRLVIPSMREQGSGCIINISSLAGQSCFLYGGWYHVSKYSVEALSDCLRMELKPFGIDVVKIEPGGIRTQWGHIAGDHLSECTKGSVYEQSAAKEAELLHYGYSSNFLTDPSAVAKAITRAATSKRPRVRYRVGLGASSMAFLHTFLPLRWWDSAMRLMGKV